MIGLYLVYQAIKMVKVTLDSLKAAQSHQKSYADVRYSDLEFEVLYRVFLKVSPTKGLIQFGKKLKFNP